MPKAQQKPDDPEQSRRFIELAREHQTEGNGKELARVVKKIAGASNADADEGKAQD